MNQPESFEIAEYSEPAIGPAEMYSIVKQVSSEITRDVPNKAVWCDMTGDLLRVHYHSYEMYLPARLAAVEDQAESAVKSFVSTLKKEYKARSKATLTLKEQKESGGRTVEKVSLNERYYYKLWKCYQIG